MFVDNGGALWLSDPSVVLVVLAGVVGLIMWCHRWLETGAMPIPRSMASRQNVHRNINHVQPRTLREKIEARPMQAANARFIHSGRPLARTRRSSGFPKQAA
jgi:hypothetical protein